VIAAAWTAVTQAALKGCGQSVLIDGKGSFDLWYYIFQELPGRSFKVVLCEGKKDRAPAIPEGSIIGRGPVGTIDGLMVLDPVENTAEHADRAEYPKRGTSVAVMVAADESIPPLYSGCRARKIVVPPGVSISERDIQPNCQVREILFAIMQAFGCAARDVHVWSLDREWNRDIIADFRHAGAVVHPIRAGDLEAHIRATRPIKSGQPVHISVGTGGLPEGVIATPCALMTGAKMFLLPDPHGHHTKQIQLSGFEHMLGRVYGKHDLISSAEGDCLMVVAGITDGEIIRGVRRDEGGGKSRVHVLCASPRFKAERHFEVLLDGGAIVHEITPIRKV
jgi:fructose-1,6-bisphosphatase/sedoheptulose 1,7-bisphosphatase-like protein